MAWAVTITHGSTTVDLANATGIKIERDEFRPSVGSDKSDNGITTDTYQAFINASSVANLQGYIRSLNNAFLTARLYQEGRGSDKVNLNVTADGVAGVWSSEVLDGECIADKINNPNWVNGETWATINITRRNYWVGPVATVPLSNDNSTSPTTSEIAVYMTNDATTDAGGIHAAYANISSSDIEGDLPGWGLLNIRVPNAIASGLKLYTHFGPQVALFWSEDNSSGTVSSSASGGQLATVVSSAGEAIMAENVWYNPAGRLYRILQRIGFSAGAGTYKIIPVVAVGLGTLEYLTPVYVTTSDSAEHTYPICVNPLDIYNIGDYAPLPITYMGFTYYLSGSLTYDFTMHAPADCVRDYAIGTTAHISSPEDLTLTDNQGGVYASIPPSAPAFFGGYVAVAVTGSRQIELMPGINQALYITGEPFHRDQPLQVTLSYYPRRLSL
jgi:hypothetical protein